MVLVPALAAVQLVLIGLWSRRRTPGTQRAVFAGFVVAPLLVLVQVLVVTDRERLVGICHAMARAVNQADVNALAKHLSERFASQDSHGGDPVSKTRMIALVEQMLYTYRVEKPRLRQFEVEVHGDRAVVRLSAACRIITSEQIIAHHPSAWEFDFERTQDAWRVTDLRPRPTRLFPYRRLADIPR